MTRLYGISNCDQIKKARKWLEQHQIDYQFHDYRKDGIDATWLSQAESTLGWQAMLNTRGTTFRQLSDEQKADMDQHKALGLMLAMPAMIKRPLLEHHQSMHLGFSDQLYSDILL